MFAYLSVPRKRQGDSRASRDALQSSRHGGRRLAWCFGVSALVAAAIKSGAQTGAFCIPTVDPVEKIPRERKGEKSVLESLETWGTFGKLTFARCDHHSAQSIAILISLHAEII